MAKTKVEPAQKELLTNEPPEFLHAPSQYYLKSGLEFVARDYPLELLATVAVRLLKGASREDYKAAAESALGLLTARDLLREHHTVARKEVREMVLSTWQYPTGSTLPGTPIIPYKKGIRILTGQKRIDRAEQDYKRYVEVFKPEWTPKQVDGFIGERRGCGFYTLPLEQERRRFVELVADGRLGKREEMDTVQGTENKSLDGNSAPRCAKQAKGSARKKAKPAS